MGRTVTYKTRVNFVQFWNTLNFPVFVETFFQTMLMFFNIQNSLLSTLPNLLLFQEIFTLPIIKKGFMIDHKNGTYSISLKAMNLKFCISNEFNEYQSTITYMCLLCHVIYFVIFFSSLVPRDILAFSVWFLIEFFLVYI